MLAKREDARELRRKKSSSSVLVTVAGTGERPVRVPNKDRD